MLCQTWRMVARLTGEGMNVSDVGQFVNGNMTGHEGGSLL
jgi:hypothetical protein